MKRNLGQLKPISFFESLANEIAERTLAASLAAAKILVHGTVKEPKHKIKKEVKVPFVGLQTEIVIPGLDTNPALNPVELPGCIEEEYKNRTETHRHIRAMLRAATEERILHGWIGPREPGRDQPNTIYVVTANDLSPSYISVPDALVFCNELATYGIKPLFRESEPADIFIQPID